MTVSELSEYLSDKPKDYKLVFDFDGYLNDVTTDNLLILSPSEYEENSDDII